MNCMYQTNILIMNEYKMIIITIGIAEQNAEPLILIRILAPRETYGGLKRIQRLRGATIAITSMGSRTPGATVTSRRIMIVETVAILAQGVKGNFLKLM